MTKVYALAKAFVRIYLREKETLFWFLLFPLLLLSLLCLIFGRMEEGGGMGFTVAVVNLDRGLHGTILHQMVKDVAHSTELFHLVEVDEKGDVERTVREGRVSAALLIPADFSDSLFKALGTAQPAQVKILYRRGEAGSSLAANILSELVQTYNREVLIRAGLLSPIPPFKLEMALIGARERVRYVDFILPGVVIMGLFVAGLFSVPSAVVLAKEVGILRQYLVAPLTPAGYFAGFTLGHFVFCSLQVFLIWILGRWAFGASISPLRPLAILYLLLGFFVPLSVGFLISAWAKTTGGAFALANIVNLPLQFLGGLYFPVTGLPKFLQGLMAINPLTHLGEGLRAALGIGESAYPSWTGPVVLLLWILLSAIFATKRLGFGVER